MKILWLSHFVPYPPAGGALQRSHHLLRHAASRHEVHLVSLHQPRLLPTGAGLREAEQVLSGLCASVKILPIPAERSAVHRVTNAASSVLGSDPFDVTWLRSKAMAAAVDAFRRTADLDLVHVDTIGLWPYVADWDRVPVVLGHHNIESDLTRRRAARESSRWRAALLQRDAAKMCDLERRAAGRAAVNLVVSALDAERLNVIAPSAAVEVVDNGVDTAYWRPTPDTGRETGIVFAGTLGWFPNRDAVEFLLRDVWPQLSGGVDRRLSIVGRDPPPMARDAAAADSRIQVPGFVDDVRPYLRDASIYVCPMRVGGGTRLKILDALAMAKPLVSTAIGVEGLDLVDGTHYVRAETAPEFVAQIERLEASPALRQSLGEAGRRVVVERYDWSVVGRKLDHAYERAAGSARSHSRASV